MKMVNTMIKKDNDKGIVAPKKSEKKPEVKKDVKKPEAKKAAKPAAKKPAEKVAEKKTFVIEKGLTMPEGRSSKESQYPFAQMEVGDSFALSDKDARNASSASAQWGRRRGKKFSVRKIGNTYRCWRLS